MQYRRAEYDTLVQRLSEPRRFIQAVVGPRQVGKTTLVRQVLDQVGIPGRYASADEPTLKGPAWLAQQWELGRRLLDESPQAVLVLDEIQKVSDWSAAIKRLWDEDSHTERQLHVVILGSAPLLMDRGMTESLAGRFETIRLAQWSFGEMESAFGFSLDEFILFGGYPGAAPLIGDSARWSQYIRDSLIETTVSRDVLLLSHIEKPALLRRLFDLATRYSGQELSYNKMLGQLQDAGNTTTLAHYLRLLDAAGLTAGLEKYSGSTVRKRASSPKLQVHDTGLVTALAGRDPDDIRNDSVAWGRLVESAVGAHLLHGAHRGKLALYYWRDGDLEVDFVCESGHELTAIEVKSGRPKRVSHGYDAFSKKYPDARPLLIGGDGLPLDEFLRTRW